MAGFRLLFAEQNRLSLAYGRHALALEPGAVCRFDRQTTNGRHQHNYFEVCLVLAGTGEFVHGGRRFALSAGDVFLAEPSVEHEIASRETRDLELVFFSFEISTGRAAGSGSGAEAMITALLAARRLWAPGRPLLARYAAWLPAEPEAGGFSLEAARRQECLFLDLLGLLAEPGAGPRPAAPAREPGSLQRAVDYINGHLNERLTPAMLALATGLSPRQLRRLFREHLGRTVVEEINRRKMNAAAHHLLMRFPITDVAYLYGMEHPSHFTRTFKQAIGVSPREFQRRYTPFGRVPSTTRREKTRGGGGATKAERRSHRSINAR